MLIFIVTLCVTNVLGYAPLREPGAGVFNDASFLQNVLDRMNRNLDLGGSFMELGNRMEDVNPLKDTAFGRQAKDAEMMDGLDYDMMLNSGGNPSIRDPEYVQHSSLWGTKYISGGGSEASAKYKGGQKAQAEIKTDAVLPAYCNPPNPCPVGYSSDDGCIETFENTAAFSRAYQASQDCMCDSEHMFDCPAPKESNSELDLTENDFLINDLQQEENPYLQGVKLPIAAKKGHIPHAHPM